MRKGEGTGNRLLLVQIGLREVSFTVLRFWLTGQDQFPIIQVAGYGRAGSVHPGTEVFTWKVCAALRVACWEGRWSKNIHFAREHTVQQEEVDDTPAEMNKRHKPEVVAGNEPQTSRLRLYIVVSLLCSMCLAYGLVQIDQLLLRRELAKVANILVDEFNKSDPLLESDEPQTRSDCTITAARKYLVVGQATGKISFRFVGRGGGDENGLVRSVSTNPVNTRESYGPLDYFYVRENGTWRMFESYYSRHE